MNWIEKAAREIDTLLGNAVKENTGVQNGYFSGVSIRDIMNIIEAAKQSVESDVCLVCENYQSCPGVNMAPDEWSCALRTRR